MICLMKYNYKTNLQTDCQHQRGEGPANTMPYYSCPDKPARRGGPN
jgi:hypothetical protein